MWTLSEILESVCVLPQLLLLRQTNVPTVIDSFYLLTLGSYRGFYILNWVVRGFGEEHHFEPIATIFGIIQTALYVDFAWIYWSRQRVKLRNGGIVDSDDLDRGWLVNRLVGQQVSKGEDEEVPSTDMNSDVVNSPLTRPGGRWGPRGISISADENALQTGKS